jgi:hypothetical protein
MNKTGKVFICHHIDTEGPLYESLEELFSRIKLIFGINMIPNQSNLIKLQNRDIDVSDEVWKELKVTIDPHTISFKGTWEEIDVMLTEIMSDSYRNKIVDSNGNGWKYNWHIMDHVGFVNNPRRRDLGYLKIFEYYQQKIKETQSQDTIHWHFHPIHRDRDAHIPATSYDNSSFELHQVISRRIIEKNWFPVVNRAGFHSVRSDSNLFLEQWIPFDPSNQAIDDDNQPKFQKDMVNGRFGDWRGAPSNWDIYHPDYADWRKTGNMKRYVARILNMSSRHRNIDAHELEKAFIKARSGEKVYVGITNHDWRDMKKEIDDFLCILNEISEKYQDVHFEFSESVNAFRKILFEEKDIKDQKLKLDVRLEDGKLVVKVINGEIFGPQPYLAIKTIKGEYFHDNFDFLSEPYDEYVKFTYPFDNYTINLEYVEKIGVASNDKYGNQEIKILAL